MESSASVLSVQSVVHPFQAHSVGHFRVWLIYKRHAGISDGIFHPYLCNLWFIAFSCLPWRVATYTKRGCFRCPSQFSPILGDWAQRW